MPIMLWDETLDIGVEAMNREHRDILDAMNKVFDAAAAGLNGPAMMALIGRLGQITAHHFADEEKFMTKIGFPTLEAHKRVHAKLLADFAAHAAAIEKDNGTATQAFFQFLRLWLSAHIKCIDRKYGEHAHQAGAVR